MPSGVFFLNPLMSASSGHVWETWPNVTLVDHNCTNGIQWIWTLMGQCVVDAGEIAAVVCGFASLLICVANVIPQIVENFRTGIPDQAVSLIMLLLWTLGDMCNFAGCILARQLILQIVVSLYSIASDLVLTAQFIYYKLHHQALLTIVSHALGDGEVMLEESDPLLENPTTSDRFSMLGAEDVARANPTYTRLPALYSAVGLLAITACSFASPVYHLMSSSTASVGFSHSPARSSPRRFLIAERPDSTFSHASLLPEIGAKLGYTLGTISSVMYICSRFPQIFLNWKRGSTAGLCLGLFCLAILGNVLYGLQIFLTSLEALYLLRSLPWLIGSLGTVFLDLIILLQFYYYSRSRTTFTRPYLGYAAETELAAI